ncbi:hypothetical protein Prum_066880 [Phytohabitans rumicis]|uniref:Uncharacterized protein n=2 Tax=Phytohabitans rumicis TaxID=1076125 RepID=A0A6V8LG32_9ACTN|nr:hypothetical protein Prum_066880 [Phytohabitans rumicis]
MHTTGRLAVVVAAAILVSVAGAGAAEADLRAMETRRGTLTLAPSASGTITVNCQSWGVAISGGFSASTVNDVIIDASRPSTNSNGWFLSALNTLGTTQTVDVFAVCASIDGRTFVSRTASVAPGANPDVTQACPTGTSNTGGGYRIDPVPRFTVMSSRPATTGQGWSVMPYNATTVSRSVTTYAVCAVFPGRQVVSRSAILEPGTSVNLAATCSSTPTFNLAVGGGWAHGGATRWLVDRSTISSLSDWTTHYVNTTLTVRYGITTYVVCATVPT